MERLLKAIDSKEAENASKEIQRVEESKPVQRRLDLKLRSCELRMRSEKREERERERERERTSE